MPRKSRVTGRPQHPDVSTLRREYESVKRLYHRVGKKAAGKPSRSQAQRDYSVVREEYLRLGRLLGRLTGKRARS